MLINIKLHENVLNNNRLPQSKKSYAIVLLVLWILLLNGSILLAQKSQTTESKADSNLKSFARINPSTLAMEFSLPLGTYLGRGGNSTPVTLNYSSKVWDTKLLRTRRDASPTGDPNTPYQVLESTDVIARFARKSVSGWVSTLQSPIIKTGFQAYNQYGDFFSHNNITIIQDNFASSTEDPEPSNIIWDYVADSSCDSGVAILVSVYTICDDEHSCSDYENRICVDFLPGGGNPNPQPTQVPTPEPQIRHVVPRINVEMPDGSSHEFRKEDKYYSCLGLNSPCVNAWGTGTYLSVDGSAMRLERNEIQPNTNNETRDVLYLPDGSRYIFFSEAAGGTLASKVEKYIDSNGNISTYDVGSRLWTDTMGREIKDPLKNPFDSQEPTVGTQDYKVKGINNTDLTYQLSWKKLENTFAYTGTQPKYDGQDTCQDILMNPTSGNSLFVNADEYSHVEIPESTSIRYIENTRLCVKGGSSPQLFNPVVLSDIQLPDNRKYEFKYNEYGEIVKIIYPTGGYERFVYKAVSPMGSNSDEVYAQTNRGVHKRFISFDGITETQEWTYDANKGAINYTVTTIAPDESYTERVLHTSEESAWGFENPLAGMPYEEKGYDKNGQLKSRTLTEWTVTPAQGANAYPDAKRDPRPVRTISIAFENGKALATMTETSYETPGENNSTAPTDLSYFARLNAKQVNSYHFLSLSSAEANAAYETAISNLTNKFHTQGQLASVSQTDYKYDANYKARGFPSLPLETRSLNPANPADVLAKSQIVYDEQGQYYSLDTTDTTSVGYAAPTGTYAYIRGNATTTRTWVKETNGWLETHSQFDTFGNLRKAWDAGSTQNDHSKFVETQYSSDYNYAYPTKVITPAPNDSTTADFGTTAASSTETTYDPTTGLPLTVKNDAGQITQTEYDALLRPWRVFAVNYTAPETQTFYGTPVNGQLPANQRFVKVKKQIDSTNWAETTTWMDGLGRAYLSQTKDAGGDVFVETKYDVMGRAVMTTNPYRANETKLWNLTEFDAAGRVRQSRAPVANQNPAQPTGDILGTTAYDFSTTGLVGTVVTTTDASGRRSRSITNALGQLLRVDEPTGMTATGDADLGGLTSPNQPTFYTYDSYGKMVKVQQGSQSRYFKYDSLGRLIRVNQPEQEANSTLDLSDAYNTSGQWTAGFSYDIFGNVLTATDARGVTITNTYDRANRVLTRTYSGEAAGQQTPNVFFTYDGVYYRSDNYRLQATGYAKGSLTQVRNGISTAQTTKYDAFGRGTEYEQITDGQTYNSKYAYNFAGALETETYPSGRTVKNEFNADGDLLRVSGKTTSAATEKTYANSFAYTAAGGISQMRLGNGKWETAKFNSRQQVIELGLGNSATDASVWKVGYDYGELDANGTSVVASKNTGNIARQTLSFAGLAEPLVQTYRYDSLYRLTEAKEVSGAATQANWTQAIGYDRYGNRSSFSSNVGATTITTTPTVDGATNRFTDLQTFGYDKNGNIKQDIAGGQTRAFTFNGENKQTEIRDPNIAVNAQNPDNNLIGKYFYDGEGKRVKKVTPTETTIFVYSGSKLIQEYSTATPPTTPATNYTTCDHLGSPRVITDQLGAVKSRRDFMPFGEDLYAGIGGRSSGTAQRYATPQDDDIRQKFTGYQKDKETQLDFAEARMYDNQRGRFTAVDPLLASGKSANPQSFNRYVYVQNSPLIATDPSGLCGGPSDPCPAQYSGPVYRNADGSSYNNVGGDGWTLYNGITRYTNPSGQQFLVTTGGWSYEGEWSAPTPASSGNSNMQAFTGGFPDAPFTEAGRGFLKGIGNFFVHTANTATWLAQNNGRIMPSFDNPLAIEGFSLNTPIERSWGTGSEVATGFAGGVAAAPFKAGTALSVVGESGQLAGSVRNVASASSTNCVCSAIVTDSLLAGKNPVMPAQASVPLDARYLEQIYNSRFSFSSRSMIVRRMEAAGSGSRGIVLGSRNNGIGHVFNAVNQRGTVRFLDGQVGGAASWNGYDSIMFLWTNRP